MTGAPPVTVVCATRNARAAVRLTFASFFRYNDGETPIFVADNGSTDGTLEELRRWPQIQLVTIAQRRALLACDRARQALVPEPGARRPEEDDDLVDITEHGATLDWLVERVTTPLVLVMDSDVEFLQDGCLAAMVDLVESRRLAALGQLEPGWHGYQPRLAPALLLLRTDVVRRYRASFRPATWISDPAEADRWARRGPAYEAPPSELASYHSLSTYPTAALLFERLREGGEAWADLPDDISRRFRHFGHMSWGQLPDGEGGTATSRSAVSERLRTIEAALRAYA
jgi:hypothetical protein